MYIIISIFSAYAVGIISYELNVFSYYFTAVFALVIYNSIINKKFVYNAVIIAFVALSYLNCNYNSSSILSQYINDNIVIEAKVKKQNKSDSMSCNASVISINDISLFNEENIILYTNQYENFQENSIIKVRGNVAGNQLTKNRMLFNYENYLRSKKIMASIFAEGDAVIIKQNYSLLNNISSKFRNYAEKTFYGNLNKKNADIILSIILGDVNYLEEELYNNIKVMGLAHIFAVSGTHIVLMYVFLLNIFKFVLNRRVSWILSWCIIWFYGFLIGFPLSIMRALVMFTLLFGSEVLYRKYNSLNSIGLAALILTVYNPFWIFDAGFLLSFSAALSFIIYNKYIRSKPTVLKTVYMLLFLQIFTLPVIVYYFNFVPVMGVLYNLLLLPIFTVIIIYGFILLLFNSFIHIILIMPFKIYDYILYSLRYIIDISDKFAFNGLIMPAMSLCHIIFFYIALFFMIYLHNNKTCKCKKIGISAIISLYSITYIAFPMMDDSFYLSIADVGQGLFTTIRYKGANIIYDCGSTSTKQMGEYIAVPYLTKRGIDQIDAIFISHWDDDHYNGLDDILNSHIKVNNIFSSDSNESYFQVQKLNAGYQMKYDDNLSMEILWPYKDLVINNANNSSLVVSMKYKNRNILLPGDIEEEAEYSIYNYLNIYDIVLVPHHGSNTSSTVQFVDAVRPKIAVLSYGRNSYGIPHQEVISRYDNTGSKIFSTYEQGELIIVLKDDNLYYNTYINEKSDNYYELYLIGIAYKLSIFFFLLIWMLKGDSYEL
ncbi:MAG: DNA internalization-related competence protein ComEC/Rec2 [Tissierellia bacterium]|nr:DNA internalization-related competence protein ComEC/Rec2 [Tissierellia bacterium]